MYLKYIPLALLFLFSCSSEKSDSTSSEGNGSINAANRSSSDYDTEQKKNEVSTSNPAFTMLQGTASNSAVSNGFSDTKTVNLQDVSIPEKPTTDISFVSSTAVEKKIIKNANVKFQVKDLNASSKTIENLAKKYGAYISSSNQGTNYNNLYNTISIRVPAAKFEELLNETLKESIYLESKNVTSQDITEEYVDTETRIKTKKDIELRYKEILRQAKTIEEILAVEAQLAAIREEIEAKEGRLKFLSDNVMYSTIQLEIYEAVSGQVQPEYGFFSKLGEAITGGWGGLLSFFLGIVRIWPLLLILAIVLLILRRWRNGRKKKAPTNL